jgi:hypothetical protein
MRLPQELLKQRFLDLYQVTFQAAQMEENVFANRAVPLKHHFLDRS